jgi:hypothetical protein
VRVLECQGLGDLLGEGACATTSIRSSMKRPCWCIHARRKLSSRGSISTDMFAVAFRLVGVGIQESRGSVKSDRGPAMPRAKLDLKIRTRRVTAFETAGDGYLSLGFLLSRGLERLQTVGSSGRDQSGRCGDKVSVRLGGSDHDVIAGAADVFQHPASGASTIAMASHYVHKEGRTDQPAQYCCNI